MVSPDQAAHDTTQETTQETRHTLSPLYGALGHANNMALAEWLLDHGANPDDNEILYHATELGHHEGLKLLIKNRDWKAA